MVKAKILLENHFKINVDYKNSLSHTGKQPSVPPKGGHNKEIFMFIFIFYFRHYSPVLYYKTADSYLQFLVYPSPK
jgi:hypothetical protein